MNPKDPQPNAALNRWWTGLLIVILGATIWVYLPSLGHELVWDDWANLHHNTAYRGFGPTQIAWAFTHFHLGHYQPLAWLTFGLDSVLWGGDFRSDHAINIALHLIAVVLFGAIARRLLRCFASGPDAAVGATLGAAFATAVFALHPMRVETVAWLTERRHLLAAVFFLAAVLVYLRRRSRGAPRRGTMALCSLLFLLSLLSTPLGITLPIVLVVLDFTALDRPSGSGLLRQLARSVADKLPLWILALGFSFSALAAQRHGGALTDLTVYDPLQRIAQAAYGLAFYPRALFASTWYPLYERPPGLDPFEARFLVSAIAVVGLSVVAFATRKRWPAVLGCAVAYVALIAPLSGMAQSGSQLVADRYGYLANGPWLLLLGAAVSVLWRRFPNRAPRFAMMLILILGIGAWTEATRRQLPVWKDNGALWNHVLERGPSGLAHVNLGMMARSRGDSADAIRHLSSAIEATPRYGKAWIAVLRVLESDPQPADDATMQQLIRALEGGLEHHSSTAIGWRIVALAHIRAGDPEAAVDRLKHSVALRPDQAVNWRWLGLAQLDAGRAADAIPSLERALAIEPSDRLGQDALDAARLAAAQPN